MGEWVWARTGDLSRPRVWARITSQTKSQFGGGVRWPAATHLLNPILSCHLSLMCETGLQKWKSRIVMFIESTVERI